MRKTVLLLALISALAAVAYALEGKNGYTATRLFTATDVKNNVTYPAGFGGVRWADMPLFSLGSFPVNSDVAVSASGELFFKVSSSGFGPDGNWYTGLIRYDGTNFVHLVQDVQHHDGQTGADMGQRLESVTVSPVTAGLLTAGHPIVTRLVILATDDYFTELWSVDPSTSPATETRIHRLAGVNTRARDAVVDAGGTLYVDNGNIQKLTWNGSGYDEAFLAGGDAWVLGGDGALYVFRLNNNWGSINPTFSADIMRIDPESGAASVYASISLKGARYKGWAWDSAGNSWLGLRDSKNKFDYIVAVKPGETITHKAARSRIAEAPFGHLIITFTGGPDGALYGIESYGEDREMFKLEPSGDGGGGGGKGGGKGPKK